MNYLPDVVSFFIATCLGCLALFPSPEKSHKPNWVRRCLVGFLVTLAVGALIVSIKTKQETEAQAVKDRQQASTYEAALQKKVDEANDKLDYDIRTKEAHPIELAAYGATGAPEVGQPLGLRLNVLLTGSKDATFSEKSGWELLPIAEDVTAYPNNERHKAEQGIWDRMLSGPEEPPRTITHGQTGLTTISLMSTPLTDQQVEILVNGRALIYYMEEMTNPKTKKVVFSFCKFLDSREQINGCFEHDKTDPEQ